MESIWKGLKEVEEKKENLKKAMEDLQTHSSLLSLPLSWPQLDAHFTALHAALLRRFHLLQSQNAAALPQTHAHRLSALCTHANGRELRDYVGDHLKDKPALRDALQTALKRATAPPSLAMDCLDGVFGANAVSDDKVLRKMKQSCCLVFRQLRAAGVAVGPGARARAKKVCAEWKGCLVGDGGLDGVGAMAFLLFVAAYGLFSELTPNEIATFSATAAAHEELPELYRSVGFADRVPALVQKLIDRCKHVMAVKYIFEFNLADKIPPVPILKSHVNESQKLAKRLSEEGKTLNEITAREIHALRSVLKVIETHNLESEYPPESIQQRIEQLTKNKANIRHGASASAKPPQHQQQQSGIKRPRISAPAGVLNGVSGASSTVNRYQQSHFQSSSLLLEHVNPYMSLPNMPYGMNTPTPTISPYTGPSIGAYGLDGAPVGPSGNLGQGGSLPNSSEPLKPSDYYDSISAYGGYGLQYLYPTSYRQ